MIPTILKTKVLNRRTNFLKIFLVMFAIDFTPSNASSTLLSQLIHLLIIARMMNFTKLLLLIFRCYLMLVWLDCYIQIKPHCISLALFQKCFILFNLLSRKLLMLLWVLGWWIDKCCYRGSWSITKVAHEAKRYSQPGNDWEIFESRIKKTSGWVFLQSILSICNSRSWRAIVIESS